MADFSEAMAKIHAFRTRFENLLESARQRMPRAFESSEHGHSRLKLYSDFGSNPGNLRMLAHIPEGLPSGAPLVVALHGCGQDANVYHQGTGWSALADRWGFLVIYPEQQPVNNPKNCFSWFLPGDTSRNSGEALSIHQMVEYAIQKFGANREMVFVTGLSAGGAMAVAMLATYPETFAAGAIIAGLPYQSAKNVNEAFEAMFTDRHYSSHALGDRVRAASEHEGPWPKISIWHGSNDPIVKPSNAKQIVQQWTDVHSVSDTPSYEELIGPHKHRVWNNLDGERLIEEFSVSGMAHGVPIDLNMDGESCGSIGPFFLDAGISSAHHIANFWGLSDDHVTFKEPLVTPRSLHVLGGGWEKTRSNADNSIRMDNQHETPHAVSDVIAAAFKAAGLQTSNCVTGSSQRFNIIEAALKAAGLKRPF